MLRTIIGKKHMNLLTYDLTKLAIELNDANIRITKHYIEDLERNHIMDDVYRIPATQRLLAYTQTGIILQQQLYHMRSQVLTHFYGKLKTYAKSIHVQESALVDYVYRRRQAQDRSKALDKEVNDHIDELIAILRQQQQAQTPTR